ncbi:hypothetical protein AGMMS50268_16850 [Spirochaetia bacterium]|nr:hypothetical protein AGMMS50268_16850 [Spirochaetia bacterium]
MPELKSCPFCGGKPVLITVMDGNKWYSCHNINCKIRPSTPMSKDINKAIEAWNKRRKISERGH